MLLASSWSLSGCASAEGENLLIKAGFDVVRADTTAQIEALKKLATDALYVVHRNGQTYYVATDPPGGLIFVGNAADYARYRKLRAGGGSRTQEAELPLIENQSGPIISAWGDWKGWNA